MVVLLEGSPISTKELWSSVRVTIGFLVTSLTKAHLPRLLSLARLHLSSILSLKAKGLNTYVNKVKYLLNCIIYIYLFVFIHLQKCL